MREMHRTGAGGENGFQGQLELGSGRLSVLEILRFADADDGDLVTESSVAPCPHTLTSLRRLVVLDRDDIAERLPVWCH